MKCPHCGNNVSNESEFCELCGTAVGNAASSAPVAGLPTDAGFILAQQEKNAGKRAAKRVAMLIAVVIVVILALLFSLGKLLADNSTFSSQPEQQVSTDATNSDSNTRTDSLLGQESVNSDNSSGAVSSNQDDDSADTSLRDFTGTWTCNDYDYDGSTRNFTVSFDVNGCMYAWIWTNENNNVYAATRKYSGSNGMVTDASGFEFKLSSDKQTLTLIVPESNQSHQMKSEYTFVKETSDVNSSELLLSALGWWYQTDDDFSFYLDTTGFMFTDLDARSSISWWMENGDVIINIPKDDGTTETFTLRYTKDDLTELTDINNGVMYSRTPSQSNGNA